MEPKKKITIIVIIALILAITAISLRVTSSDDVPTSVNDDTADAGAGRVGVTILLPNVEDKLSDDSGGNEA